MRRIGVDVGGTFTDLVYVDDESGAYRVHKVSSTPEDPADGVLTGTRELLAEVGCGLGEIDIFFYGTTIATNILIQHNGARVGMITTAGFRDILHIARKKRPLNFSHYQDLPWQAHPIVARRHRLGVPERISARGDVLVPLDEAAVQSAAARLVAEGVEAVAICFLFSFANPEHELRAKAVVEKAMPGTPVWTSAESSGQYREYERFATTAVNGTIGPPVRTHLERLEDELHRQGLRSPLYVMASDGGAVTVRGAQRRPVELVMSGPAAGLIAGIRAGEVAGNPSVITLDVGGTSADIGVAPNGEVRMKHLLDTKVAGHDLLVSMAEVETIGAGGGSVAFVDQGGMFRVGPRSAGARPGPACYCRGGQEPTATDALLALGWLDAERFLGGGFALDAAAARRAIGDRLAGPLERSVEAASLGVARILVHHLVAAIRLHSTRKGYDPRDFSLIALGGAGPMFAGYVAMEMAIPSVVVPPVPGAGSASGLLATDLRYERVVTVWTPAQATAAAALAARFAELEDAIRDDLAEGGCASGGSESGGIVLERQVDVRYADQGYELRIGVPAGEIDAAWLADCVERFHREHRRRYLERFDTAQVDLINVVVTGRRLLPRLRFAEVAGREADAPEVTAVSRTWWLRGADIEPDPDAIDAPRYRREDLRAGDRLAGPALVDQLDTTTVVPPGITATVLPTGHLELRLSG